MVYMAPGKEMPSQVNTETVTRANFTLQRAMALLFREDLSRPARAPRTSCPHLSHRTYQSNSFSKVNSPTNPSTEFYNKKYSNQVGGFVCEFT